MSSISIYNSDSKSNIYETFQAIELKSGKSEGLTFLTKELFKENLNNDVTHCILSKLSIPQYCQLKRVSTIFRENCDDVLRPILVGKFEEYNCSRASTISLLTYLPFSERIPSILLKAFGRSLREAPFIGVFNNHKEISQHDTAIAKGFVPNQYGDFRPFFSFYIGKRNLASFTTTVSSNESKSTSVNTPFLRFIYTEGMFGHTLYASDLKENIPFLSPSNPTRIDELAKLSDGFGLRETSWKAETISFISQVFDQKHPDFILWTKAQETKKS